jgi:hypothetical protein
MDLEEETYSSAEKVVAAFLLYMEFDMCGAEWKRDMCYFKFPLTKELKAAMEVFNEGLARVEPRAFNRCFARVNRELHTVRDLHLPQRS